MQPARAQGHVALEVHLPQVVGRWMLEAGEARLAAAQATQLQAVAMQDLGHGGRRRSRKTPPLQNRGDLATAPRRMLAADRQHRRLDRRRRASR